MPSTSRSRYLRSAGTLPPFAASFCMTCLCSQMFIDAESFDVAGVAELLGQLLARAEAAVELEQLHQIDDRFAPVELFLVLGGKLW